MVLILSFCFKIIRTFCSTRVTFFSTNFILILLISINVIVNNTHAQKEHSITVVTGEWSPYTTQSPNNISTGFGGGYGLAIDIVTPILQGMDLEPVYKFCQWYRVSEIVKKGEFQIGFPFIKSEKRLQNFLFSDSLFNAKGVLFINTEKIKDITKIMTYKDLSSYTLGIVSGYEYDKELSKEIKNKIEISNEVNAFEMLINGKIQVLPAEERVGKEILEHYFFKKKHRVAVVPALQTTKSLHLIASRANPESERFIEQFNDSLKKIRETGVYDEIISKHRLSQEQIFEVRLAGPSSYPLVVGTVEKNSEILDGTDSFSCT